MIRLFRVTGSNPLKNDLKTCSLELRTWNHKALPDAFTKRNGGKNMFSKNKLIILGLIIALVVSASACGANDQAKEQPKPVSPVEEISHYPITITDSYDRKITIENEPERIISIAPSITETIFALDSGDKLVGRTDYCKYPEEVENIESIGSLMEPNIEKIIDLKPDIVIASTHFKEEVLNKLEEVDIKVAVLYGEESFEGVYEVIGELGKVLNQKDKSQEITDNMNQRVENVLTRVKDIDKPSVYYVVGFGEYGDFTAGGDTFIGQIIEMAGGKNAASDVSGWKYSLESLVEKDPDILICSMYYNTKESLMETNGYKDLTAVKEGRLYEINNDLLELQGPRLIEGLEALAEILHPTK